MPLAWPYGEPSLYSVKTAYSYLGKPCENEWTIHNPAQDSSAGDILDYFLTVLLPAFEPVTSDLVTLVTVDVFNYDNGLDSAEGSYVFTGALSGQGMPPWDCWCFDYVHGNRYVRNGWKRWSGITEGSVADGVPTSTLVTALDTLASVMSGSFAAAGTCWHAVASPANNTHASNIIMDTNLCRFRYFKHQTSRS